MRRLFPILAAIVAMSLAAGYSAGLVGRSDELGRGVRLASSALAIAIHAWAFAYLWATARRVEAIVGREGLPDWVGAQAEKNRRKALLFQVSGSVIAIVGAGLAVEEYWQPVVYGASVSFQIGFFIFEAMIVANQSRLLEDLGGRSGSGRPVEGA